MGEQLRLKIIMVCQMAMLVALMATVGCICLYRHYQERLNDRLVLEEYMNRILENEEGASSYDLDHYKESFCVCIHEQNHLEMIHNSMDKGYSEAYLFDIVERIRGQVGSKGVQSGFLFHKHPKQDGLYISCRSLKDSYKTISATFMKSFVFGFLLCLLTSLLLRSWINQVIEPIMQANQAQIQFFSDVGHELKTPLAIISANTEVLELSTGENQWTKTILRQVDRMTDLVQNMLMLTRLEIQKETSRKEVYSIGERILQELEAFQVMADMKWIQYEIDIDESAYIIGDPVLLDQMVIELLNNGLKYTPEGGIISASLKNRNHQVCLRLWNTHAPLSKEDLNRIFQRFYRVDTSRSQETSGFGIGLAAVKSIVEKHNGSIRAYNQEDGICFEVILPVSDEN